MRSLPITTMTDEFGVGYVNPWFHKPFAYERIGVSAFGQSSATHLDRYAVAFFGEMMNHTIGG